MTDQQRLQENESAERAMFKQFYEQHIKDQLPGYTNEVYYTSTSKDNTKSKSHDAVVLFRDAEGKIAYKWLVEIKVRTSDYDSIMLELKKHYGLFKDLKEASLYKSPTEELGVLYVNFTPSGAYVFNLSSGKAAAFIDDRKNLVVQKQVKTTFTSGDQKVDKKLFFLPIKMAKHYPFIYTPEPVKPVAITETPKDRPKTYSIF